MQTKLLFRGFLSQLLKRGSCLLVIILLLSGNIQSMFADNVALITQQQVTATGVVLDEAGEPLPMVNILLKGSSPIVGTTTTSEGTFSINVPSQSSVLVFSYIGFTSQEITVGAGRNLSIVMVEDTQLIDDVIVTGYTSQRRVTMTGSVVSVSSQDITVTKNENVVNMLTGKLPGVRITQRTSQPGSYDTNIDIRGFGTPLFVIDGIPRDFAFFARMDPEEIESVSVLKDASAAIYGVRAANGVMLITTKKGTSQGGKVDISYTANYTLQTPLYMPKGVSALEHMELRDEQHWQDFGQNYLVRRPGIVAASEREPYLNGKPSYDWMGAVLREWTPQTQHNLSINGGSDKLSYFFSLGYQKQESIYKSGDLIEDRWNFRSNVNAQINSRLKATISTAATLSENNRPIGTDWAVFKQIWLIRPDAPIYANDNPNYLNGDASKLYDGHNMIAETTSSIRGYSIAKTRRMNGTLSLSYDIPGIKGLTATSKFDYSLNLPENTNYTKTYYLYVHNSATNTYNPSAKQVPAGVSRSANFNWSKLFNIGLNYNGQFGSHGVNSFLLFEESYNYGDSFTAYRDLYLASEYLFAGERNANTNGSGGTPSDGSTQAIVGQLDYNYSGKYMLGFRFRYDASSRFPKDSRWGLFPSLSLAWRISEEGFIKNNIDFLSDLKLRASYGIMGDNSSASNYPSVFVGYNINTTYGWYFSDGFVSSVSPTSIPNPNLTWYKTKLTNLAVDFGLFKNKLTGSAEIYRRNRTGLLATSSSVIPGTVGASLPQENLNADRVFGWEVELKYKGNIDQVRYNVSTQMSATRTMRLDWLETPADNSMAKWRNRSANRYQNIGWSTEAGGMFTNYDDIRHNFDRSVGQGTLPGDWWAKDWNQDGIIDSNDSHPYYLTGVAKFNYSVIMGAFWRAFDITMNWQGTFGVYTSYGEILTEALSFGGQNTLTWFMDRWHPEDVNADYFHPNTKWIEGYYPVTGHDGRRSWSNNINNARYVRLKSLDFGYNVPKNILSVVGVKNLRIYFNAYNLLTFTPLKEVDPERPGGGASDFYSYPINKTFNFGGSIRF